MIKIILTANLQKYFPQNQLELSANSVFELLQKMDQIQPRFSSYILEDDHSVRKHVNIFIDGKLLPKNQTQQSLKPGQTVHIMQALSGG
jgi:sulfur-carrier protein